MTRAKVNILKCHRAILHFFFSLPSPPLPPPRVSPCASIDRPLSPSIDCLHQSILKFLPAFPAFPPTPSHALFPPGVNSVFDLAIDSSVAVSIIDINRFNWEFFSGVFFLFLSHRLVNIHRISIQVECFDSESISYANQWHSIVFFFFSYFFLAPSLPNRLLIIIDYP